MNRFALHYRGCFAGEFVITNEQCSFSIGDYIKVVPTGDLYPTGETVLNLYDKELPIFAMPLTIVECCHAAEIKAILQGSTGVTMRHWIRCLEIEKVSTVIPYRYQHGKRIWYVPNIDGWVIGMFGKVKAPTHSNLITMNP